MERDYNRDISQRVVEALKGVRLRFSFDSETGIVKLSMGQVGPFRKVDVWIETRDDDVMTYAFFPLHADSGNPLKLADMAEFITRANYGLCNGCFEMDFSDGEIRFKSYIDCEDVMPGEKVILNSVFASVAMIKRYTPGFAGIIFSDASPADMIAKCESDLHSEGEDVTGLFNRLLEEIGGVGNGQEEEGDRDDSARDEGDGEAEAPEEDPSDGKTDVGEEVDDGADGDDEDNADGDDEDGPDGDDDGGGSGYPF